MFPGNIKYAYGHPLFTEGMHIYSDTKVSDFLCGMTGEESAGFLNDWNASCDHREKIYISYDSSNKNSEAGSIEMVEFGEAKVDVGLPIYHNSNSCLERQRDPYRSKGKGRGDNAAIRELEKIEMIRGHDQIYRLDHAVTKTQKTILKAFGMDTAYVKNREYL